MPTEQEINKINILKAEFDEEFGHGFLGQGVVSLIAVIIAFVASIYMFGWLNWYLLYFVFMAYIFIMIFQAQTKRIIIRRNHRIKLANFTPNK